MYALAEKVLDPSVPLKDKRTYLVSLLYYKNLPAEPEENIKIIEELLSSPETRRDGLLFLRTALERREKLNEESMGFRVCEILKESDDYSVKELSYSILTVIVERLFKSSQRSDSANDFLSRLIPVLMTKISENEWALGAIQCLAVCLKEIHLIPPSLKNEFEDFLLEQIDCVSTDSIEAIADCYVAFMHCIAKGSPKLYKEEWLIHYKKMLTTMQQILNNFVLFITSDQMRKVPLDENLILPMPPLPDDVYISRLSETRRFVNLCKCLAKMISSCPEHPVHVPVLDTLNFVSRMFNLQELVQGTSTSVEVADVIALLPMMQDAVFVLLEALILKFDLRECIYFVVALLETAIKISTSNTISRFAISRLRFMTWSILHNFLKRHGAKSGNLFANSAVIIEELLKDISVSTVQREQTSKPHQSIQHPERNNSKNYVSDISSCTEALKALRYLIATSKSFIRRKNFEEILTNVLCISKKVQVLQTSPEFPFPYTDEDCRKHLLQLLMTLLICKYPIQASSGMEIIKIVDNAIYDPSIKVTGLIHHALLIFDLYLHPNKPSPESSAALDKSSDADVLNVIENEQVSAWENVNMCVMNNNLHIEKVSVPSETPYRVAEVFHSHNENDLHQRDFVPAEAFSPHYSEQQDEGLCNGDDAGNVLNSSQSHDSIEYEDDIEEVRSYTEEEMNQDLAMAEEPIYIPTQSVKSSHVNSTNEQSDGAVEEYDELTQRKNNLIPIHNSNNGDIQQNGMCSTDEELPSTSCQKDIPENGAYAYEEEDVEEEEEDEEGDGDGDEEYEVDEEEETPYVPSRKHGAEYLDANLPSNKRLKVDDEEVEHEEETEGNSESDNRSPTFPEMCADFNLVEAESVNTAS
ncbi:Proline-, glutamic acid- and leucine-rich protein 1, partial [Stegodyphus mimosarum]